MTHEISHYAEVWPGSGMYVICECDREFRTTARHAEHQQREAAESDSKSEQLT